MARETHPFERCEHPGRHGYTLPGDPAEFEFCERCRRPESVHPPVEPDDNCADCRIIRPPRDWADPELGDGAFYSNGDRM